MMYSQGDEEAVILDYFKDDAPGHFIDIGASDGVRFSNTRALYERGWKGVFVEPSPRQFLSLHALYKDDPSVLLCNLALSALPGITTFYYSPDTVVNTVDKAVHEVWSREFKYSTWSIGTVAVSDFWKHLSKVFPRAYSFISVDAEGLSWEIAASFLKAGARPRLWCIEHEKETFKAYFDTCGYKVLHENGNNSLWCAK